MRHRLHHLRTTQGRDKRKTLDLAVRPTVDWDRIDVADERAATDFAAFELAHDLALAITSLPLTLEQRDLVDAILANPSGTITEAAAAVGVSPTCAAQRLASIAKLAARHREASA